MKKYISYLPIAAFAAVLLFLASCDKLAPGKAEVEASFDAPAALPELSLSGNVVCNAPKGIAIATVTISDLPEDLTGLSIGMLSSTSPDFGSSKFVPCDNPTEGTVKMNASVVANSTYYLKAVAASPAGGASYSEVVKVDVPDFNIDWSWLEGDWNALDYSYYKKAVDGDPYPMEIKKVDETHCTICNIWGTGADLDATVDFEKLTLTIPGYQNLFYHPTYDCDLYFVAVDPRNDYDVFEELEKPVVAKMSKAGIVIDNYDFFMVGGQYDGYTFSGGLQTTLTK